MDDLPRIKGRIVVVGDVMRDVNVRLQGPIIHGSDQRAEIEIFPGGAGANQAAWMAHFKLEVALFSCVADTDRDRLAEELAGEGITPWLMGDKRRRTGRLISMIEMDGERSFLTDRGANLGLSLAGLPLDWMEDTGLLVVSGYSLFEPGPRGVVREMIARARERSLPVVTDVASIGFLHEVGTDAFLEWVKGVTILVANGEEAALLAGHPSLDRQAEALANAAGMVVIKKGGDGSVAAAGGRILVRAPTQTQRAFDTTGAGDAFLAGFVAAWHQGANLVTALEAGNMAGKQAVMIAGGRPPRSRV